ncbi:MAG TPA: DUF1573 domain-containing protein [Flavobacterium sp.]|jgi:hypothetical protein
MKKGIFFTAIAFIAISSTFAQESSKKAIKKPATKKVEVAKVDGPGIVFESETIDYGTIAHNADGKREFVFVNNGNKPLIITNAQGSCGCTVPSYPKEPIAPGAKAVIGVKYATDRVGAFTKTVTLTTNATTPTKTLTIKGTVLPDTAPKEGTKI